MANRTQEKLTEKYNYISTELNSILSIKDYNLLFKYRALIDAALHDKYNISPNFKSQLAKLLPPAYIEEQSNFFHKYKSRHENLLRKYNKYSGTPFYKKFQKSILDYQINTSSYTSMNIEKFFSEQESLLLENIIDYEKNSIKAPIKPKFINESNLMINKIRNDLEKLKSMLIVNHNKKDTNNHLTIKAYSHITDMLNLIDGLLTAKDKLKIDLEKYAASLIATTTDIISKDLNEEGLAQSIILACEKSPLLSSSSSTTANFLKIKEILDKHKLVKFSKNIKNSFRDSIFRILEFNNINYLGLDLELDIDIDLADITNELRIEKLNDFSRLTAQNWQDIRQYFRENNNKIKFSKKDKNNKFGVSFIKIKTKGEKEDTYEIYAMQTRKIIGKGGFGRVKLAVNEKGESIAIKIESARDADVRKAELSIIRHLKNYYIYDTRNNNKFYTAMHYYKDGDLYEYINKDEYESDSITKLKLAIECTKNIMMLHKKGIIHNDIKAENFMVNKNCDMINIVPIDYGLSMKLPKNKDYIEQNSVCGTYGFIAPEVLQKGIYSYLSDSYALAVMLKNQIEVPMSDTFYKNALNKDYKKRTKLPVILKSLENRLAYLYADDTSELESELSELSELSDLTKHSSMPGFDIEKLLQSSKVQSSKGSSLFFYPQNSKLNSQNSTTPVSYLESKLPSASDFNSL